MAIIPCILRDSYQTRDTLDFSCSAFRVGCACMGNTAVLCAEVATNALCCPTNVCIPEIGYRLGLPVVYSAFDALKKCLRKEMNDI